MGPALDIPVLERELDQRIAILRRYRKMLELQRQRFQDYLTLLDVREQAVKESAYEKLEDYAVQEQQVIKGILAVQKCIKPLAELYKKVVPEGAPEIDELSRRLKSLHKKVLARNEESRDILKVQADLLKAELNKIQTKGKRSSLYNVPEPRILDIQG